ncbi:malate/L-lactate dehydrogenase [Bordetella bronchiseptica MBORD782]|nr:malate/L-lactate dehydrogenase [Bordetella bronchiseptica MBORD782]
MTSMRDPLHIDCDSAQHFTARLFERNGLEPAKAAAVARSLVRADMMGHDSHGLALASWYLDALADGQMASQGAPEVIADRGACFAWNGQRLPGAWLIERAMEAGVERVRTHGSATCTIANSFHAGALAVYLEQLTAQGLLAILTCSGPASRAVAPFGGTEALFSPNPLAAGIPTSQAPMLMDISCSITTTNRTRQLARQGRAFPAAWALTREGKPTDDPRQVVDHGGSLLPVGGVDHGHKGYAMALMVEALTQGLSGYGRNAAPTGIVTNIYLHILDPEAFGGRAAFLRETDWMAASCTANPPRPGVSAVRVPGQQAQARLAAARAQGLRIAAGLAAELDKYAARAGVQRPWSAGG